jgi:hypothetical protein
MQLKSGSRDHEPAKDHLSTPDFIVSVARGIVLSEVRPITQLCVLGVTVKTYVAPQRPLQFKR